MERSTYHIGWVTLHASKGQPADALLLSVLHTVQDEHDLGTHGMLLRHAKAGNRRLYDQPYRKADGHVYP